MSEQKLGDQPVDNPLQEIPDIPTRWISQTSDEELRRQHMTWANSEKNKNSPQGKILIPLLQAEMQKRGVKGFNLNPDDPKHFEQLVSIVKGTSD